MERQRMMMMTEAFVLPMLGLLVMIALTYTYLKDPLAEDYLVECRAEQADVKEHMDRKTYVTEEAYRDMLEGWPRRLSETCQAVLQNHQ